MNSTEKQDSFRISAPRGRRPLTVGLVALAVLAGCGSARLETGYTPRPLNASDSQRRAYYSGKYTKEAVQADQERETEFRARRPGL